MKDPLARIDGLLSRAIAKGYFPSAGYLLAVGGRIIISKALGDAVIVPERIPATTDTIYDIASLTKPLVTTTLVLRARERKWLALDDSIARFLPECDRADKRSITIRHCLTHTAGFPSWRPIYAEISDRDRLAAYLGDLPLAYAPGTKVVYSDLGFIALGAVLERVYEMSFDELARREIFDPLGLKRTAYNPPPALRPEIAGSETTMDRERALVQELGYRVENNETLRAILQERPFIWGEVQDGNAYFLGGAAGHGGLFSTLAETHRMAEQYLPHSQLLRPESRALASRNATRGLGRDRSLGWMLASTRGCAAGRALPPNAFGHTGFTGTSLWIDPDRQRVYILFTNRGHPTRVAFNMNKLRQRFHLYAARALDRM